MWQNIITAGGIQTHNSLGRATGFQPLELNENMFQFENSGSRNWPE